MLKDEMLIKHYHQILLYTMYLDEQELLQLFLFDQFLMENDFQHLMFLKYIFLHLYINTIY